MFFLRNGKDEREKYLFKYMTIKQYLKCKCENKNIADVFIKNNYKTIAIYGIGEIGQCLWLDLKNSDVNISCFIDKNAYRYTEPFFMGYPLLSPEEVGKKCSADMIVITPIYETNDIIDLLLEQGWQLDKIMNLSEVVFE